MVIEDPLCSLGAMTRAAATYDLVIRGGTIYDGSGAAPVVGDLAIDGDAIAASGSLGTARGQEEIDAAGLAVAPGFINMLSWAAEPLIADGRSQSDIRQGVTLEVFGEGFSLGPLSESMKKTQRERQSDITYDITWTTLDEGLRYLVDKGVSCNVGSFVGATSLRVHEVGHADRRPTADELDRMRALAHQAMTDGAFGVGSSLIYAPACFAETDELIALAEVAAAHGGMYISHIRNEGERLLEAIDEFVSICRRSGAPGEIWHFKASAPGNWHKFDAAIERVNAARAEGCGSPPTCTRITRRRPAWTPPCRAGCRRAAIRPGLNDSRIRPCAPDSGTKCRRMAPGTSS